MEIITVLFLKGLLWKWVENMKSAYKSFWQALDKCYPPLLPWLSEIKGIWAFGHWVLLYNASLLSSDFSRMGSHSPPFSKQLNLYPNTSAGWGGPPHPYLGHHVRPSPLSCISRGPNKLLKWKQLGYAKCHKNKKSQKMFKWVTTGEGRDRSEQQQMKIRWKHGETPQFPLNRRQFMLPACEGIFPLNFWWKVMELWHMLRRQCEGQWVR